MQDWQIRPLSKKSYFSEKEIVVNDEITSAVFLDEFGNIDRIDCHKQEFDKTQIKGKLLGKWERVVSENQQEQDKLAKKIALASSEDFFLSLYDNEENFELEEVDVIKQILALLLERKRILRPIGKRSYRMQKYVHIATKKEFEVPQGNLDEELIIKIQTQLGSIII